MFCFAFSAAGRAGRALCGCVCTMLFGGPILIIVGIVLLTMKNNHANKVREFNDAVDRFNETLTQQWIPANMSTSTSGSKNFRHLVRSITISGNTDDAKQGFSSLITSSFSNPGNPVLRYQLDFNLNQTSSFTADPVAYHGDSETLTCDRTNSYCTAAEMRDECRRMHGNSATYDHTAGSRCDYKRVCGTCRFSAYLSDFCVVVTGSGPFAKDTTRQSCYYPFSDTSYKYKNVNSWDNVDVTVMHSSDPFLVAQRVTEGSMDFGVTSAQQRGIGLALIGVGGVCILTCAALCFCLYKLVQAATGSNQNSLLPHHQQHGVPPPGTYPPPPHYQQPPQPYYPQQHPQPQPQYHQQQYQQVPPQKYQQYSSV